MEATTNKLAITEKPVWFITGCSTGFGRELAKHVLELGYRTVVTARNPDEVSDLAAKGEDLVLKLDVTDQGQIDAAIKMCAAYELALAKLGDLRKEFSAWEAISRGADFPRETQGQAA